jgi:hypothetical protein
MEGNINKNSANIHHVQMLSYFELEKENFQIKQQIEEKLRSNQFNALEEKKNCSRDVSLLNNRQTRDKTPTPIRKLNFRAKPKFNLQKNDKEFEENSSNNFRSKTPVKNYRNRKYREISRNP